MNQGHETVMSNVFKITSRAKDVLQNEFFNVYDLILYIRLVVTRSKSRQYIISSRVTHAALNGS